MTTRKSEPPSCRACARPARTGCDGFCSDACRVAFEHEHEIVTDSDRETAEGDRVADIHHAAWRGGRRINLQNSA